MIEKRTYTQFITTDGRMFVDEEKADQHETELSEWDKAVRTKIGHYEKRELLLGGSRYLSRLPYEAPWLTPFGVGLIHITDLRRNEEGVVEFQLADENCIPYDDGDAWAEAGAFYPELPQ